MLFQSVNLPFAGHVDFWPNQGRIQPSCEDDLIPDVCSHSIACDYYRESISQCFYSSNPCRSEFEAKNVSLISHHSRTADLTCKYKIAKAHFIPAEHTIL